MSGSPSEARDNHSEHTVLVVHADARLSERLELALSGAGFEVSSATDNDEALSKLSRIHPDLVLIDLNLARTSASEFCRTLHDGSLGRRIPFVALSDGFPDASKPGVDVGAEECVARPFSPSDLVTKIRRILERSEETRALNRANAELSELVRKAEADSGETRDKLRDQAGGLRALAELNHAIDPGFEAGEGIRAALRQAVSLFRVTALCFFERPGPDSAWFVPLARHGVSDTRIQGLRLPTSGEFMRILASARRPLRIDEFEAIPGTAWEAGILTAAGFSVTVPVILHHELTGILVLSESSTLLGLNGLDMDLLILFASTLGHVSLMERSRETGKRLALGSVALLVDGIEAANPFFVGHSRRVARLAEAMGRHLGFKPSEITDLIAAAHLHDVGLSTAHHGFLSHPGPLSVAEWEEMRRHPAVGAQMVARAGWSACVQDAIRHHHEKWSGGGYPSGIRRQAIPIGARILAVAEAFDAMTSARPYRGPYSESRAHGLLKNDSGLSFDPDMVDALLALTGDSLVFKARAS